MSKVKDNPIPEFIDLPLTSSKATSFLTTNGIISHPNFEFTDVEMISLHSLTYTSLKDILPPNRSPTAISSPTNNSSWYEIPIKNPLVKQAALSYLQPMSIPTESDDGGFLNKLKEKCCCGRTEFGCFALLAEFFRVIRHAFRERSDSDDDSDEDDDDDDKVD